jgi:hypothetical protein
MEFSAQEGGVMVSNPSSASKTGTTGNINDGGRDSGMATPDFADSGKLQSASNGQPGASPAQGNSRQDQFEHGLDGKLRT